MPNGFENPYMTTEGDTPFDINALIQYITDVDSSLGDTWTGSGWSTQYDPESSSNWMDFNVNLPTYGYQGMSPEIMQALGSIFTVGEEGFDPQIFGEDFITSQIQEQLGGLTEEDLPGMITEMPEGELQVGVGGHADWPSWFQGYSPSISEIGDWDYGDMQGALGFTNIFDPESIAATLSQLKDTTIAPSEVKALTPEMVDKTTSAYYQPVETAQRESLIEKLGGARSKVGTGGFAGSGARTAGLSGAERLYRGGYEDILADIMKMKGGATENIMDTIFGWGELG